MSEHLRNSNTAPKQEKNKLDGVLLIDKPEGMTSADVLRVLKKKLKPEKIGHAGTLDPMATGLLVVLLGKATKLSSQFLEAKKAYSGVIVLGKETDTDDITGKTINLDDKFLLSKGDRQIINSIKEKFCGQIEQVPPQYSAIKISGKKSYELARNGIEVSHQARTVTVESLQIEIVDQTHLSYNIFCSKGFYVRSFARDVGRFLGTYGCLESIRRIKSEPFDLMNSLKIEDVDLNSILLLT